MGFRVLILNLKEKSHRIEDVEDESIKGIASLGIHYHFKYKSYMSDPLSERNILFFGAGPLTGRFPGFARGIVVFRSPLHGGIHISTGGDFGEFIKKAGYDGILIEEKSEEPIFVYIRNTSIVFLNDVPSISAFDNEKYMYKKYKTIFGVESGFRVITTGFGSKNSYFGSLITSKDEKNIGRIPSIFGRGGVGSVMVQAHNLWGIAIGGDKKFEFDEEYKKLLKEIIEATKKYREKGTFGANYPHLKENTIMFNWKIFYLDKEERTKIYNKYIIKLLENYKPISDTCGERCVASCKKIEKDVKLDYEPVEGLGPFIGIFNRDLVRELVHKADDYGFDAIYLGQFLGFLMEALEEEGIDIVKVERNPVMNPERYDKDYSDINHEVALKLIKSIVEGEIYATNIRTFSKTIGFKGSLYTPYGDSGDMTPNFYWTLGLVMPIAMHGKYYSDYHPIFKEPEEYGELCAKRTLYEFTLDNFGICRFHRGWVEPKFEKLFGKDIIENSKEWIKKIYEYRNKTRFEVRFYDNSRTIEILGRFIEEKGNEYWSNLAKKDYKEALREYWDRFRFKYEEVLGLGVL